MESKLRALRLLVLVTAAHTGACGSDARPPSDGGSDAGAGVDSAADTGGVDGAGDQTGDGAGERLGGDASSQDASSQADAATGDRPVLEAGGGGDAPSPPSTTFQITIPATQVLPDGVSMIPIVIRGMRADGSAGSDEVVLRLSRATAGFVRPRVLRLGGDDPQSYFTPCLAATAGCLGPVKVQVARTSAPDLVVAESGDLNVATGEGVTSAATCLLGGNVLFIDGSETRLNGVRLLRKQTFTDTGSARSSVVLNVREANQQTFDGWEVRFSSGAAADPLSVRTYLGADNSSATSPRPHMQIGSPQMRCSGQGNFQIHRLVWAGNQLQEVVASFEQVCEYIYQKVRGCIRFAVD